MPLRDRPRSQQWPSNTHNLKSLVHLRRATLCAQALGDVNYDAETRAFVRGKPKTKSTATGKAAGKAKAVPKRTFVQFVQIYAHTLGLTPSQLTLDA